MASSKQKSGFNRNLVSEETKAVNEKQKGNSRKALENEMTGTLARWLNLVVVGSSAGGLEALQEMLAGLPELPETAILIAQHLSPVHKSMLVDILKRESNLVVKEATDAEVLQAGFVYVTPPDADVEIQNNIISLSKPASGVGPKPSVDRLFLSAAKSARAGLIGVILSGTGTDGAEGAAAIHHAGGYLVVQEPDLAKYNGMPSAVIQQGIADEVVAAAAIGRVIRRLLGLPKREVADEKSNNAIAKVLRFISEQINADFSSYKSATIRRRMQKRINQLHLKDFEEYLDYLSKNPEEAHEMFSMMLIGVTSFFRDKEAFDALKAVVADIIKNKQPRQDIRVWVPGCSTGEEAYSIAILFHQALGGDLSQYNVQIFASDIDDRAIQFARKGLYNATALEYVSSSLREAYFTEKEGQYELNKSIRNMVLFSKHDVTRNPPFLKLDLISCRNLLIYFDVDLQQQVMPIFHYALNHDGYLFLGRSETVGQFTDLFAVIDQRNKLFRRLRGGSLHTIQFNALKPVRTMVSKAFHKVPVAEPDHSLAGLVKETLFNSFDHPYVVINTNYDVLEVFGDVRLFLGIPQGSMQINLLKLINKDLMPVLRSLLTRALKARESVASSIQRFELYGTNYYLRFVIKPIIYSLGAEELFLVIFELLDINAYMQPAVEVSSNEALHARLAELENELAVTREHLQSYIEELETGNEELQSLNEELQSTNEEFQSTNEELETTNEELQATNEEMHVAYASLDAAKQEMEEKERLLRENKVQIAALLENDLQAFMLIDASYRFQTFNKRAAVLMEQLSGKQIAEGLSIVDFVHSSQLEQFISDFRLALSGRSHTNEVEVVDQAGEKHWYLVNFTPGVTEDEKVISISLSMLDITHQKTLNLNLDLEKRRLDAVLDATVIGVHITDESGKFISVNKSFCDMLGYTADELVGQSFAMLMPENDREAAIQMHKKFIESGVSETYNWSLIKKDGDAIMVLESGQLLKDPAGRRFRVCSVSSIMERLQAEAAIKESEWRYRQLFQNNPVPAFVVNVDDFNIVEMNSSAADTYQKRLKECDSNSILSLFVQDEADKFSETLHRLLSSDEMALRLSDLWAHQIGNGQVISTELNLYKTQSQGQTQIIVNAMDVTPILESEKMAARLLAERNAIIDSIGDGFWVLTSEGICTYWNSAAAMLTGVSETEILGRHYSELNDARLNVLVEAIGKIQVKPEDNHFEVFDPNHEKWFDIRTFTGNDLLSVYFRDVTERHSSIQELKNASERFEWIASAVNASIWDWDILKNKKYVNENYSNTFGKPNEEVEDLFTDWVSIIHPEDRARVLHDSEIALKNKTLHNHAQEYRMRKKNGEYASIIDSMKIVRNEEGEAIRVVGMVQDVTAQRRFESIREQLNENLRQQAEALKRSNMELEQFAYVASHDLQEPVRSVISFIGKLEALVKDRLNEREMQYLHFALGAGRKMRQIIMDLLEYSRVGRQNDAVEEVNVGKVVGQVLVFLQDAIQANGATINVGDQLPTVMANNLQVYQLFQNVIGNAIKYCRPGVAPVVNIAASENELGDCVVSVTDNGIGIPAAHQSKIFELFQRLHQPGEYSGSGLGLAIAKKIMVSLNGSIDVESEEGVGTTFLLTFPKHKLISA